MPPRIAFYPCCACDFSEALLILADFADEVVFCDASAAILRQWKNYETGRAQSVPKASFVIGDVRDVIKDVPAIDVLFYRRDSNGEGGSGLFVLGDAFLPTILGQFNPAGGLIITDGSNSRGGTFKRMIRPNGLTRHGWRFSPPVHQPLRDLHGLWVISALPLG